MSMDAAGRSGGEPDGPVPGGSGVWRRFTYLAVATGVYTYLLIVFGGIVRITGSGLGCGDDWPKCHGQWIPLFDLETFIEWFHRLLAAGLLLPILALLVVAWRNRGVPGFTGRAGQLVPALVATALLVVQALLGALTVKLELPPAATVLHFGGASALLAVLIVMAVRAHRRRVPPVVNPDDRRGLGRSYRAAMGGVVLGFLVVLLGALTANVGKVPGVPGPGTAAWACGVVEGGFWRSFPLCNGRLLPGSEGIVHVHWTHRLLAFLLFFHVASATIMSWRRGAPAPVRRAAAIALGAIVLQLAVAAKLILFYLPDSLQVMHLVAGVAIWAALVYWVAEAGEARRAADRPARPATSPTGA